MELQVKVNFPGISFTVGLSSQIPLSSRHAYLGIWVSEHQGNPVAGRLESVNMLPLRAYGISCVVLSEWWHHVAPITVARLNTAADIEVVCCFLLQRQWVIGGSAKYNSALLWKCDTPTMSKLGRGGSSVSCCVGHFLDFAMHQSEHWLGRIYKTALLFTDLSYLLSDGNGRSVFPSESLWKLGKSSKLSRAVTLKAELVSLLFLTR